MDIRTREHIKDLEHEVIRLNSENIMLRKENNINKGIAERYYRLKRSYKLRLYFFTLLAVGIFTILLLIIK